MTPEERIERRAIDLFVNFWDGSATEQDWTLNNVGDASMNNWRRLARLTFQWEHDAAILHQLPANDARFFIVRAYAGLLPQEEHGR